MRVLDIRSKTHSVCVSGLRRAGKFFHCEVIGLQPLESTCSIIFSQLLDSECAYVSGYARMAYFDHQYCSTHTIAW